MLELDWNSNCCEEQGVFLAAFALGEIWLYDVTTANRWLLGEAGSHNSVNLVGVRVLTCFGRYVFVGEKRTTKAPLQVFDVSRVIGKSQEEGKVLRVECGSNKKHRGLGCILPLKDSFVLIGSGRGIAKGYVWLFHMSGEETWSVFLGSVTVSSNTISAMRFCEGGSQLVTVGYDGVIQVWDIAEFVHRALVSKDPLNIQPFDLRTGQGRRIAIDDIAIYEEMVSGSRPELMQARVLGESIKDHSCAVRVLEDHSQFGKEVDIQDFIRQKGGIWEKLFPPRLLDPTAYDGEFDDQGRAHGFGVKLIEDRATYEGDWEHGQRHGKGQLFDMRTSKIIYVGGWKNDRRHGFGIEIKGSGGEVYEGWFQNGERQGLGKLYLSRLHSGNPSSNCKSKRIQYTGFFRHGKRHGLGWWTWPKECTELPFAVTLDSIRHLGSIRCITQFKDNEFFDEFNFHRVDGEMIDKNDRMLFNFTKTGLRSKFSESPTGEWSGLECWSCMQIVEDADAVVCQNTHCRMRVHRKKCLSKLALVHCCWEDTKKLYCNDVDDEIRSPTNWFCPMPACQKLIQSVGRTKLQQYNEEDEEEYEEAVVCDPASKKRKYAKTSRCALGEKPETKHILSDALQGFTKRKSGKRIVGLKSVEMLRRENSNAQFILYQSLHDKKQIIETDSDLEEAVEESILGGDC
eukprot:CAMPEP_0203759424 /NCGR_PEP_ID=MMETSP0098-20131031/12442_1 /ASSEMBLY_ACC=CAM_ASM_000208 /TAXON_ID=96639 /ORGANISM=" , Strain NY0313808BC1" /LENGTH=682 /DNA_ID=CAMNT_0050652363 /DNA_START=534 /DNA_END=2579 /DNA_ORIENTATION=-